MYFLPLVSNIQLLTHWLMAGISGSLNCMVDYPSTPLLIHLLVCIGRKSHIFLCYYKAVDFDALERTGNIEEKSTLLSSSLASNPSPTRSTQQ
jgi:hypothetical protein